MLPLSGGIFKGVGHDVEEHALNLLDIHGGGESVREVGCDRELDVALAGHGHERLGPLDEKASHGRLGEIERQAPVLVFAEVKYLVYKPAKYPHVLVGDLHQRLLARREVVCRRKLFDRLGNEGERGAKVVRDVGEENQF